MLKHKSQSYGRRHCARKNGDDATTKQRTTTGMRDTSQGTCKKFRRKTCDPLRWEDRMKLKWRTLIGDRQPLYVVLSNDYVGGGRHIGRISGSFQKSNGICMVFLSVMELVTSAVLRVRQERRSPRTLLYWGHKNEPYLNIKCINR